MQPAGGLHFLRSAPLPPPPRAERGRWFRLMVLQGDGETPSEMGGSPSLIKCANGCVVGIRRPNAFREGRKCVGSSAVLGRLRGRTIPDAGERGERENGYSSAEGGIIPTNLIQIRWGNMREVPTFRFAESLATAKPCRSKHYVRKSTLPCRGQNLSAEL